MGTRKQRMVEKKIKSLVDGEISTLYGTHFVVVDEVLVIKFKSKDTFESFIKSGVLVEVGENEPVSKIIPIIPAEPKVDESGLPFVGEDVEETPLDEAGEPEGKTTLEDEYQFEPPATREVEEILFEEQDRSKPHQPSYFDKVKDENRSETGRAQL